jgi:hypothetical protein
LERAADAHKYEGPRRPWHLNSKRELIRARTRDPDEGNKERTGAAGQERRGAEKTLIGFREEIERQTMGRGLLEVNLIDAKGLAGTDFLGESVELPPRMFLVDLASICPLLGGWRLIDVF